MNVDYFLSIALHHEHIVEQWSTPKLRSNACQGLRPDYAAFLTVDEDQSSGGYSYYAATDGSWPDESEPHAAADEYGQEEQHGWKSRARAGSRQNLLAGIQYACGQSVRLLAQFGLPSADLSGLAHGPTLEPSGEVVKAIESQ